VGVPLLGLSEAETQFSSSEESKKQVIEPFDGIWGDGEWVSVALRSLQDHALRLGCCDIVSSFDGGRWTEDNVVW
jgi:hypothetical protein